MAPFLDDAPAPALDCDLEDYTPRRKARITDWSDVPGIEDRPDNWRDLQQTEF